MESKKLILSAVILNIISQLIFYGPSYRWWGLNLPTPELLFMVLGAIGAAGSLILAIVSLTQFKKESSKLKALIIALAILVILSALWVFVMVIAAYEISKSGGFFSFV